MTPDTLAIFAVGITVGVWLTLIIGMVIYTLAGREDVPVVTGAHSGDDDLDDDNWLNDNELMRGRAGE